MDQEAKRRLLHDYRHEVRRNERVLATSRLAGDRAFSAYKFRRKHVGPALRRHEHSHHSVQQHQQQQQQQQHHSYTQNNAPWRYQRRALVTHTNDWMIDEVTEHDVGYLSYYEEYTRDPHVGGAHREKQRAYEKHTYFLGVLQVILLLHVLAGTFALVEGLMSNEFLQLVWFAALVGGATVLLVSVAFILHVDRAKHRFSWRHMMIVTLPLWFGAVPAVLCAIALAIYVARYGDTFIEKTTFATHFDGLIAQSYFTGWIPLGFYMLVLVFYSMARVEQIQPSTRPLPKWALLPLIKNRYTEFRLFNRQDQPLQDGGSRSYYVFIYALLLVLLQSVSAVFWSSELAGARYLIPNLFVVVYGVLGLALVVVLGGAFISYRNKTLFSTSWRHSTDLMLDIIYLVMFYATGLFAVFYWVHSVSTDPSVSPPVAATTEYIAYKNSLLIQVLTTLPCWLLLYRIYVVLLHAESNYQHYATLKASVKRSGKYAHPHLPITQSDPFVPQVPLEEIEVTYDSKS